MKYISLAVFLLINSACNAEKLAPIWEKLNDAVMLEDAGDGKAAGQGTDNDWYKGNEYRSQTMPHGDYTVYAGNADAVPKETNGNFGPAQTAQARADAKEAEHSTEYQNEENAQLDDDELDEEDEHVVSLLELGSENGFASGFDPSFGMDEEETELIGLDEDMDDDENLLELDDDLDDDNLLQLDVTHQMKHDYNDDSKDNVQAVQMNGYEQDKGLHDKQNNTVLPSQGRISNVDYHFQEDEDDIGNFNDGSSTLVSNTEDDN